MGNGEQTEQQSSSAHSLRSWAGIIQSVTTPLAFMVLGFLVVDGTVATLAVTLSDFRTQLVWTVIISVPFYAVLVAALAVFRPEALKGYRPLGALYGRQFASDLFIAMDGSLQNLPPRDRIEAWTTLSDVIQSESLADAGYQEFCASVAKHLTRISRVQPRLYSQSTVAASSQDDG